MSSAVFHHGWIILTEMQLTERITQSLCRLKRLSRVFELTFAVVQAACRLPSVKCTRSTRS